MKIDGLMLIWLNEDDFWQQTVQYLLFILSIFCYVGYLEQINYLIKGCLQKEIAFDKRMVALGVEVMVYLIWKDRSDAHLLLATVLCAIC